MMRNSSNGCRKTKSTALSGVGVSRPPANDKSAKPSSDSPVSVAIDISTIDEGMKDRLDMPSLTYPIKGATKRPSQSQQRKKYVSIATDEAAVHEVEGRHQYSPSEVEATWYSRNDVNEIKSQYKSLINQMRIRKDHHTSTSFDNDNVSTRGLECQSKAGSRLRRQVQIKAMVAVFEEQERHRRKRRASAPAGAGATTNQNVDGDHDENDLAAQAIAIVYRQCSYHSQQAAANMGRRDEHAIADYYRPTWTITTTTPNHQHRHREVEADGQLPMAIHSRSHMHHHQQLQQLQHKIPQRAVVGGRLSTLTIASSSSSSTVYAQQPRLHLNLGLNRTTSTHIGAAASATVDKNKTNPAGDVTRIPRRASAA